MADLITTEVIADNTVYGVKQTQYTVDGDPDFDYTAAVTFAAFKEAVAIESATSSYSGVVKARQRKIDDLSEVLAYIAKANAKLPPSKKGKSTDKVTVDNATWIKQVCNSYGFSLNWDGDKMDRGSLQKAQTEVQYQIDKEDNNLQQDMVTLQSYISKRDNAYSTASKVVKKTLNASASIIGNIGR